MIGWFENASVVLSEPRSKQFLSKEIRHRRVNLRCLDCLLVLAQTPGAALLMVLRYNRAIRPLYQDSVVI